MGTQQSAENHEPSWSVFAQYCSEQDSLILTLLPRSLDDLVMLEKEVPEIFYSEENFELNTELVLEEMISEQKRRRRQESEKSTASDQSHMRHKQVLPVLLFNVGRSKIRDTIIQEFRDPLKEDLHGPSATNRCWPQELLNDVIKRIASTPGTHRYSSECN